MSKKSYFTLKDIVSFGNYLLSEQRENSYRTTSLDNPNMPPYEDRFRNVSDADIANWKEINSSFSR